MRLVIIDGRKGTRISDLAKLDMEHRCDWLIVIEADGTPRVVPHENTKKKQPEVRFHDGISEDQISAEKASREAAAHDERKTIEDQSNENLESPVDKFSRLWGESQ